MVAACRQGKHAFKMSNSRSAFLFVSASLVPAICLLLAAVLAGPWPAIALLSMTFLVVAMDRFGPGFEASTSGLRTLPVVIGVLHFPVLYISVWAIGREAHFDTSQALALFFASGLFVGQVSNACAHEMIHRSKRPLRMLGTGMYCSLLNGKHVSAHLHVHHVHAGTENDPNSAPLGRSYFRYAVSASLAELRDGLRIESQRHAKQPSRKHPFVVYWGSAVASLAIAAGLSGFQGVLMLLLIALYAQMQLLLSDYVQHYGLRRRMRPDGKLEPMGPAHSWNAPQPWSGALTMNAPLHSDHHAAPSRDFAELRLDPSTMPMLPYSLPVMGAIALCPPLWRRLMDHRVREWVQTGTPLQTEEGGQAAPSPSKV